MKKIILLFLVQLFIITAFAKSQNSDGTMQQLLNHLLLITNDKINERDYDEVIKYADSINNKLESVADTNLSNELKASLSNVLLRLDKQTFYKPKRVENYLNSLSTGRTNDIYDYLLNKNYHVLRSDYGWNPNRIFKNLQTFDGTVYALNYKFYSDQGIDNDFAKNAITQIIQNTNASNKTKENLLIKLCSLIRYDSLNIDVSVKKSAYSLLARYISDENKQYLFQFNSLNKDTFTVSLTPDEKTFYAKQQRGSLWAGIEVGSSAVKLSLIEFLGEENGVVTFQSMCEPKTLDIESRAIDMKKIKDIAKNVKTFYECIFKDYPGFNSNIEKVFVAYSSGFCTNFRLEQKDDYLDSLDSKINQFLKVGSKRITHLTPEQESAYTFLGIVQTPNLRDLSVVIDIGNGNTKGGFFAMNPNGRLTQNDFQPINFDLASGSLKAIIDKQIGSNADIKSFSSAVSSYMRTNSQEQISDVVHNKNKALTNKRFFYFAGGISWVISTLKDPNNITFRPIEITENDITSFINSVTNDYDNMLSKATDNYKSFLKQRKDSYNKTRTTGCLACDGYEFIFEKFDQKLCIAGATVLLETMRSLKAYGSSGKRFFVATTGKLAWTNGFIANSLE